MVDVEITEARNTCACCCTAIILDVAGATLSWQAVQAEETIPISDMASDQHLLLCYVAMTNWLKLVWTCLCG